MVAGVCACNSTTSSDASGRRRRDQRIPTTTPNGRRTTSARAIVSILDLLASPAITRPSQTDADRKRDDGRGEKRSLRATCRSAQLS